MKKIKRLEWVFEEPRTNSNLFTFFLTYHKIDHEATKTMIVNTVLYLLENTIKFKS